MAKPTATGTFDTSAELGQAMIDLVNAQTRHSLEILTALTGAVDWNQVFRLQSEFLHESLERAAQLAYRSLDATQAMLDVAADNAAAQDQGRTAA